MITLPDEIVPAISDLTANNILVVGDYGIGKTGLLASTGYLLVDPEGKSKSYPCLPVVLKDWADHKELVKKLAASPGRYKGVGLDSLNISYDHCSAWVMKNVRFAGSLLTHPSESAQLAYPRITNEFITWLREMTYLGYHIIATCHTSISEVRSKSGAVYNRWVPAFTGGSPGSTYSNILKIFSVVGFMTLEEVVKPSTRSVMGKAVPDARADGTRIETAEVRVIHFNQSPHWLANNRLGGFPDEVVLTNNWKENWDILQKSWGTGDKHEETDEVVQTEELKI